MPISLKYDKWKPGIIKMLQKHESMRVEILRHLTLAEHKIVFCLLNASLLHSASYRAGFKQWELEREKVAQMKNSGNAKNVVAKYASSIGCKTKNNKRFHFCFDRLRQKATADQESLRVPRTNEYMDFPQKVWIVLVLNSNSRHTQIKMDINNVEETAFVANIELY